MVISRVMSLKEYLRYQAGLTIIPISDQWVNDPDCGTTNPSLFFVPKAAEKMSCLEICECAVLAEKTGNRRILASFEVNPNLLGYGEAAIHQTMNDYSEDCTVKEAYLSYYNQRIAKLIFIDKDFDSTVRYANDIVSLYSEEIDYPDGSEWTERKDPQENIRYPYLNRIVHWTRNVTHRRNTLSGVGYETFYKEVLENKKEEGFGNTVESLYNHYEMRSSDEYEELEHVSHSAVLSTSEKQYYYTKVYPQFEKDENLAEIYYRQTAQDM